MATRTITIALEAKVGGLVSGFKTAQQAASDFGSKTEAFTAKNRESLEGVGKAGMVAGGVLVAGFAKSIQTFASFDKAMSSVKAATHESAENMELLSEAAIKAGADTAYSAEEAAGAIEELAKAGVATADILNGGLDGALSLAAAGNLDVAQAAETAASAMVQFGLKGADIPHIADLLAAGAGKAQGSVHDLGMALNQAGLVANSTGLTIEETTGGLAAFASAGLVGSDAGTSFKSMLQRLNPQSKEAANLMADLGLSAYDSQGEFIGLSEYAGELKEKLSDMSSEQRNATMQTLFGSDAVRAANVLYEQGSAGIQEWEDAVSDAGYASETAALMQNNLAGDLEKLGGAFDTVFLKAGGAGNDGLRGLVQTAEDLVDAVGKIPAPVLGAIGVIGGLTGGALLLGGAFFTLAPRVFETVGHMRALNTAAPGLTTNLQKIGKAAGVAMGIATVGIALAKIAESSYMDDIDTGMGRVSEALADVATNGPGAASALDELFRDKSGGDLIADVEDLEGALDRTFNKGGGRKFNDWAEGIVNGVTGIQGSSQILEGAWGRIDTGLSTLVSSGNAEEAAANFERVQAAAEAQGISVEDVAALFPEYADALAGAAAEQALVADGTGAVEDGLAGIGGEAEAAVIPLEDIVAALFALGMISMSSRDSTAAFHQALRDMHDATVAAGDGSLGLGALLNELGTDFDLTTEAGAAANAAFQNIATSGMTDVEAKAREGLGQAELQENLHLTYDSLIAAADGMGIVGDDAVNLARDVLGVPDNVDITTWMSDAAKKMAGDTDLALDGIPRHVDVQVSVATLGVAAAMQGIAGIAAAAANVGSVSTAPADPWYAPKHTGAGSSGNFASGGAVLGRGTSTSDSINARLSNGEHVLDAADVQAMGGQSAVYAFRAQLDAGVPPSFSAAPAREYSAPSAGFSGSGGTSGTTIEMPITINGATDVHAVRQAVVGDIKFLMQKNGVRLGD